MASLDKIAISTVIFFVIIVAGVLYVHDIETSYVDDGVDMGINEYVNDTYFLATSTYIDEVNSSPTYIGNGTYDYSSNMNTKLFGADVDEANTEDSMFAGSFSVIKLVTSPIKIIKNVLDSISLSIGIPTFYTTAAFTILIIVVMFSIIFLIFRVRS